MEKKPKKTKQAGQARKRGRKAEATQNSRIIFEISGRVINRETKLGAADLRIEAWHKGGPLSTDNKLIGPPPSLPQKTTAQGDFHITATDDHFEKFSIPRKPNVFFRVYGQEGKLLTSTEDAVLKNVESGRKDIVIEVDIATNGGGGRQFIISGQVTDPDTTHANRVGGLTVQALANGTDRTHSFGTADTNSQGLFRIQFSEEYLRQRFPNFPSERPNFFFSVFCNRGAVGIGVTSSTITWPAESTEIKAAVTLTVPDQCAPDRGGVQFTVEGKVSSRVSAGIGGLRVQIVDKTVGGDVPLAEVMTSETGAYLATFTDASLRQRRKAKHDLQARVFTGRTFLGASDVRYDASTHEILNVLLDDQTSSALSSEYDALKGAIANHYRGNLGDLQETDERQDVTYLANKTGWDARAVALAALAEQFSQRANQIGQPATDFSQSADHLDQAAASPGISPVLFYALFRAGLPANEDALYRTDAGTVKAVWNKAAEQGVIPKSATGTIPQAVAHFQTVSAQKLLTAPALTGTSSFKDMLVASRLDDSQQTRFAELYTAHRTDLPKFWSAVTEAFGSNTANRLQVDGKLGFLTLNNVPLMQAIHTAAGGNGLNDPLQLAQQGYYSAAKWTGLLTTSNAPIPTDIPGNTPEVKRANYAEYLAAQVRLSYPTASVAQMVKTGDLPLPGASRGAPGQVHRFLTEHQGKFEIGLQPVQQYIARNNLEVGEETVTQVKRLQRVFQITPSDRAMTSLMKRGMDAAYHVVRYEKDEFVRTFAGELGGAEVAALTYDKSVQVHNATLNIAISYLTARNGIGLGAGQLQAAPQASAAAGLIIQPAPQGATGENAGDVIAYPTLEGLFGEMDFCACDHCRSILSPAAYLVDLLHFIDQPNPPAGTENPQAVLFSRRPDIQHLPLTCENTNTALPYIDVVNETLEYFIANNVQALSLNGYLGHDTDGAVSADLLASPQFVMDAAYTILRGERFPAPLPFHQPLENLRRYFEKFEVPLPLAMERLRKSNALERGANPYGWRDILMEELRLSRDEHEILSDSNAVPLWRMYGFPNGTTDANVIAALSNAKLFTRRVGVTYEEIVAILQTRFVNPNSDLIPKLERLRVPFATLKALKDGTITDAAFDALLPTGTDAPDPAAYGGDIKAWVRNSANYDRIMGLITLTDPTGDPDPCNFDTLEFRFSKPMANPADTSTRLGVVELVRLLRFIRLWKKLGWTIEQTDAAICALWREDLTPVRRDDIDTVAELDAGFLRLLPRLGIIVRVINALNLKPKRDLLPLLACWSEIGAHGESALYRQMFLNPAILKQDAVFADNGFGEFLQKVETAYTHSQPNLESAILNAAPGIGYNDSSKRLLYTGILSIATRDALKNVAGVSASFQAAVDALYSAGRLMTHSEALRSALNLTGDEYDRIVVALFPSPSNPLITDPDTPLTIPHISAIFRRGYLARKLKLSVRELLLLTSLTGLDPFAAPDATDPAILRLIALVQSLKDRSLKTAVALYLIWNQDLSGKSAPASAQVTEFARTLRGDFAAIEDQFAAIEDPSGNVARARMALVYGQEAADAFFALLDDTLALDVVYTHPTSALEAAITAADPRIAYDNFRHRLSYTGVLTVAKRDALKAVPGVPAVFQVAVDALFARSEDIKDSFFAHHPELKPLYDAYIASAAPVEQKRSDLLAAFRPELARQRKRQQALQRFSAAAGIDLPSTLALLAPATAPYPLHAAGHSDQPALNDVLALETPGLAVRFFFRDTATGVIDLNVPAASNLDYDSASVNSLPANTATPGAAISGIWSGQVEIPEAGFYNFVIETDAGATVTLTLGGQNIPLTQNGNLYRNAGPLELKAGTLMDFELKVEKVKNRLSVKWETPKRPRDVIPSRYLYPPTIIAPFTGVYVRFLKAVSLAEGHNLTANEIAHFATDADYQISGDGWLNVLPVSGDPTAPVAAALLKPLRDLLDYARIKSEISPDDESLLAILKDPTAATAKADSLLFTLTRWEKTSLNDLLAHFGGTIAGLSHFDLFRRVYDAFALVQKMGVSASALTAATTNDPTGDTVRDFQAALRARYDAASWRDVVQPINDAMRGLQRDALVSYILHQMRSNPATAHIDTADKLFEYFLMDVQMEPCMQTSRIRHALSSAQLFIERCLMNLEPRVSPSTIIAKQWEWMKRYRVWEANRKVFLFPENWAEPELRDDQSPFFKEAMSELLQGDITEERAAVALLNYLSKLEEVAKLEPCGIHYIENNPGADDDIAHVVARTSGANRKYFYRRREFGYWTPWEHIKLDIEDNPLLPVVWNNRLFLFWLRILKQTPIDPNALPTSSPPGPVTDLTLEQIKSDAKNGAQESTKITVQAVLCWSEFFNGKWQPTRTSDIAQPLDLGESKPNAFDRSILKLSAFFYTRGAVRIIVSTDIGAGASFFLHNVYSSPVPRNQKKNRHFPPKRTLETANSNILKVSYPDAIVSHPVLTNEIADGIEDRTVDPHHPVIGNPWDVPFFYEDSRHVFYVTTAQRMVQIPAWLGFGVVAKPPQVGFEIPHLVLQEPKLVPDWIGPVVKQPGFGVVDPTPMKFVISEDAYIQRGIGTLGTVRFGDKEIGPGGSLVKSVQKR
jgi:hypothetical protein